MDACLSRGQRGALALVALVLSSGVTACSGEGTDPEPGAEEGPSVAMEAKSATPNSGRTITADVVALDQVYVYNRFGAFNPAGMIYALKRDVVPIDPTRKIGPGNAMLREDKRPRPLVLRVGVGDTLVISFTNWLAPDRAQIKDPDRDVFHVSLSDGESPGDDSPATRFASIHINGLVPLSIHSLGGNIGKNASSLVAPGATTTYTFRADKEGPFFMHSAGAMSGGEGDGGQITQGLFGAVNVEPAGSVWYRSQVTARELERATAAKNPDGTPQIDYDAVDQHGVPILRIADDAGDIVHSDLNAIVTGFTETSVGTASSVNLGRFREFTVLFHDELNAVQAFEELDADPSFHGVRDGFGINYGAAGLGAELLANRQRIGPTKDCVECKFEDFFLTSWANGDPALNVERKGQTATRALYPDDPSNVHHSYLGDPVRFRNIHAGPKETHVFHLHAHQWLKTPNGDNSTYLDSQTIGPGAAFTYDINYGGGGNRNFTVGDAIFHCHLYPHFAQGMWELWRNHDVFEAGTKDRNLPDGEIKKGTPTPALVPVPGLGMASLPTYEPITVLEGGHPVNRPAMPGYPFYIAAREGHRASQPPLDMEHDGGLPRHIFENVPPDGVIFGAAGRFDVQIFKANLKLLPQGGTPAEQAAMQFHAGAFPGAAPITTIYGFPARAYPAFTPEGTPSVFTVNGQAPSPGAPYADPCPPSAPVRHYRAAYLQIDGVINKAGWHDPQMRLAVLEEDYEATKNHTRPPEPLFFRANSGECITFSATNTIPSALAADDFQIFTPTDIIGQHIHLVKFDVTSSDGAENGFNYEDGTLAPDEVVARINAANALGGAFVADGSLDPGGPRVTLSPKTHPRLLGAPLGAQTTVQRWWADPLVNSQGQDRTIRTVFTHDHLSPSSHQHHGLYAALLVEPAGSLWRDPTTGAFFPSSARKDGGPTSFRADILSPDQATGEREFALSFADFAIVYDAFGKPVNPPNFKEVPLPIAVEHALVPAPEVISAGDPGTQLINYRNEPIPLRIADRLPDGTFVAKDGPEGEMHNVFRSPIHGDPFTPLLRIYEGDRAQIRLIQGAQEEQHVFSLHGYKWLSEVSDPDSGFVNSQAIGISEHMEFELDRPEVATKNDDGSVDYLYESAPTDDLWDGMWGLLRAHGQEDPDLVALPDNPPPSCPRPPTPVCPEGAPERRYTVHAILAKDNLPDDRLTYNERFKIYDPDAILMVEESRLEETKAGKTEPLILRATAGDCIKVTLVNDLPCSFPTPLPQWSYLPPITERFNVNQVKPSDRVSLHPQLVDYDVNEGDGAAIGQNEDQTVGPGEERTYTWYAGDTQPTPSGNAARPIELGAVNLKDMADVVQHGMHGSIGGLIVEPLGATWTTDPGTMAQATVHYQDANGKHQEFREFVVFYQDELGLHSDTTAFQCQDSNLNCGTALRNIGGADDSEETGQKAFNFRNEPLWARLGLPPETPENVINDQDLSAILSSAAHGDPETPIFTAKLGMPLRFRVLQPSGHRRQHALAIWGTEWTSKPWEKGSNSTRIGPNPESYAISTQGGSSALSHWNIVPFSSAGGPFGFAGDYLYRDQPSFQFPSGLWGLVRVSNQ